MVIPDVGPRTFRYSESDRADTPRFWMAKLQREVNAFAHEVVRAAAGFPQMVISSPALRAGYARLVEWEIFRVIEGRSQPQPTHDAEPMVLDAAAYQKGVPELVAAELVRDVVEPKEFDEFCRFDCVTVLNGGKYYRIPRRPHALIEVWDAKTHRAEARLCVVFQDPGMPPSDEVVMKYLLAKHQPDMLWQVGVRFSPPTGRFEAAPPRAGGRASKALSADAMLKRQAHALKKCNPGGRSAPSLHEWMRQGMAGGSTHRLGAALARAILCPYASRRGRLVRVPGALSPWLPGVDITLAPGVPTVGDRG